MSVSYTHLQLDTIRTAYPGLWKATRAACDAVQQQFVLPAISDAEAAYLAMQMCIRDSQWGF